MGFGTVKFELHEYKLGEMMKKNILVAFLVSLGLGVSTLSLAQSSTPTSLNQAAKTTVSEILTSGKKDQLVSLKGQISRQLGSEKYMLTDDTGVIQIEIDQKLSQLLPITPPVEVELFGEVDKEGNTLEIEVKYYSLH